MQLPTLDAAVSNALVKLNQRTHRTFALPILMYAPTSRCNSRCVSCDWWRTDGASDLKRDEVQALADELPGLRTRLVVFTGGEPLVRPDVFELADIFRARGLHLHLLTSGLALEKMAPEVVRRFDEVTISLDGHTPELYRSIRGVDGLAAVERGVRRLKELRPAMRVRARSTLQRLNYRALPQLIDKALAMGLDQISFLTADVTSESFGRQPSGTQADGPSLLLDADQSSELERVIDEALRTHAWAFAQGRVAEKGDRLRRLGRYYQAQLGARPFPPVRCNAPWTSAVVESDGTLRPCFFQPRLGNIRTRGLRSLMDREMVEFRRSLDVSRDPTCQRCVCSIQTGLRSQPW